MTTIAVQRRAARPAAHPARGGARMRAVLLVCGVLSSLLYLAMLVFVAMRWASYSSASRTVSELSALGAPTRPPWVALAAVYTALVAEAAACAWWDG